MNSPDPAPQENKNNLPQPAPKTGRFPGIWTYPLAACFVLLLVFSARTISDWDLGFHLKGGEWITRHLSAPKQDTFTYGAAGHEYVDSHCLYQVTVYLLYRLFGYSSLTLLNMGVILCVFVLLMFRVESREAPRWVACLFLFLAILMMEPRFNVRPDVVSWLFFTLTYLVLDLNFRKRRNLLGLLPVIQLFWVNMEGLFVLGWALCGAYFASGWFHQKKWDKPLFTWTVFSILAGFLNLNLIKGLLYPLGFISKLQGNDIFHASIYELYSPWFLILKNNSKLGLVIYAFFSLAVIALFLLTLKKRKAHEGLILAAFFYLSSTASRNISIFTLACLPIGMACVSDFLKDKRAFFQKFQPHSFLRKVVPLISCVLILLLSLWVMNDNYYVDQEREHQFGIGLNRDYVPVQAADFLARNQLNGRIFNHLNLGGWLDWMAPQPPYIDGRLEAMGEDLFREFGDSLKPDGLSPLVAKYGLQMIIFDHQKVAQWHEELLNKLKWRPIYLDPRYVIYAAPDYAKQFPDVTQANMLERFQVPPFSEDQLMQVLNRPSPSSFGTWLGGFVHRRPDLTGWIDLALYCFGYNKFDEAHAFLMEALRQSDYRSADVYNIFGLFYLTEGKYPLSSLCAEKALSMKPGNPFSLKLMSDLNNLSPAMFPPR